MHIFNHLAQRETIFLLYEKETKKLNRQPKEYAAPEEQSNVWDWYLQPVFSFDFLKMQIWKFWGHRLHVTFKWND